jgi:hypothetical protein
MKSIERIIELNESHVTAKNFALDLRNPEKGMHAEPVESRVNEECWNVRLVINLTHGEQTN